MLRLSVILAGVLTVGSSLAQDADLPPEQKAALRVSVAKLMDCAQREDWRCRAELMSRLIRPAKVTRQSIHDVANFGSRIVRHRIDAVTPTGLPHPDARATITGCVKLRNEALGYRVLILAFLEDGGWRFVGPTVLEEAVDAPLEQCEI